MAIRPKTLPAAIAPVWVGSVLAYRARSFSWVPALVALGGALSIQIASNLANDVFDFEQGKDTAARLGPTRAVQSGLLSARAMRIGLVVALLVFCMAGCFLVAKTGWPLVVVGAASILAALAYTAGPYPLGYHGLGDLFVFLFFGPVAVVGTQYAIAGRTTPEAFWASLSIGSLATNILVVNNLRDRAEDAHTGKRTLAVRFGEFFALSEAAVLLGVAYLAPTYFVHESLGPLLLPMLTLPWAVLWFNKLSRVRGRPMNALLGEAGQLLFAFATLFALGLWVAA
jgi:1,4-dihydroxy-2-naphthoate octaprenyltransferase